MLVAQIPCKSLVETGGSFTKHELPFDSEATTAKRSGYNEESTQADLLSAWKIGKRDR